MTRIVLVLAMALLALPASATNGWTKEDRETFMSGCIEEAPTRMTEEQVLRQCGCWTAAFENAFSVQELRKALDSGDPKVKRVVDECTRSTVVYQR